VEAQTPQKLVETLYDLWVKAGCKQNHDELITGIFRKHVNLIKHWTYLDLVMSVFSDTNDINSLDA
jgi:hypothetical protein